MNSWIIVLFEKEGTFLDTNQKYKKVAVLETIFGYTWPNAVNNKIKFSKSAEKNLIYTPKTNWNCWEFQMKKYENKCEAHEESSEKTLNFFRFAVVFLQKSQSFDQARMNWKIPIRINCYETFCMGITWLYVRGNSLLLWGNENTFFVSYDKDVPFHWNRSELQRNSNLIKCNLSFLILNIMKFQF